MTDTSPAQRIEDRLTTVERRLSVLTRTLSVFAVFAVTLAFLVDVLAQAAIPAMWSTVAEVLADEPMPALTLLVVEFRLAGIVVDVLLLGAVIGLAVGRRLVVLLPVAATVAVLMVGKALLTSFAMELPLLRLLDMLGA